jgi:hypothetical protein
LTCPKDTGDSLPWANFTTLSSAMTTGQSNEFESVLRDFILRHPELETDPRQLEIFRYCYAHYVNFDPELRDLSIQEKLERTKQMATEFMGSMFKF